VTSYVYVNLLGLLTQILHHPQCVGFDGTLPHQNLTLTVRAFREQTVKENSARPGPKGLCKNNFPLFFRARAAKPRSHPKVKLFLKTP
jgi:hypothetical protein